MNLGLVTGAYDGYGRYLVQWARFVAAMNPTPTHAAVALGRSHGATSAEIRQARALLPGLIVVKQRGIHSMGEIRNAAIGAVPAAEWIQWLSIDDGILPDVIASYDQVAHRADWICIGWLTRGLGCAEMRHQSPVPADMARRRGRGFVIAHSPYRRWLWERSPYVVGDYPNAPFLAAAVEAGARFVKLCRPVTIYLRRCDSHSRTVLQGPRRDYAEKRKAIMAKRDCERRIVAHFAKRG